MSARRDIGMAIAMLVEAFNVKEITPVRIKIYEQAFLELPPAILEPMVKRAIKTRTSKVKDWMPSIEELLSDAEAVRLEMRAAVQFQSCANCSADGWIAREIDGVMRMVRCACWQAHQQKIAGLGVGAAPLALPPARTAEWSQVGE